MKTSNSIGISQLSYKLPKTRFNISQLEKNKLLNSSGKLLSSFGFKYCYIKNNKKEIFKDLIECGNRVIKDRNISPNEIDYLVLYSGHEDGLLKINEKTANNLNLFRFPVANIQNRLNLNKANSFALSQQGCGGSFSTINIAKSLLDSSEKKYVLCLMYSLLPKPYKREITYNILSDAAGSILIQKNSPRNKILGFYQESKPYYWDTPKKEVEIVAAYFPVAQRVINKSLNQFKLKITDIDWFIPHNVSLRSWHIFS